MISHEAYLQFIRDVQEPYELSQVDECRKVGDNMGAKHHAMLAEIYKSLLNLDK